MVKTLQISTRTDLDGHLRLDVPIARSPVDLSVIIVMNPLPTRKDRYDCSDLAGRLRWRGDAVKEQRALRDQWT
jgi:hypothetical protein